MLDDACEDAEEEEDEAIENEANEAADEEDEGKQSLGSVKLSKEELEGHEECPLPLIEPELELPATAAEEEEG